MKNVDPELLEPFPTVLEILRLPPELTHRLQETFTRSLQQPSYVSHARIATKLGTEEDYIENITFVLPLGLVLYVERNFYQHTQWMVKELTLCCGRLTRSLKTCPICKINLPHGDFEQVNISPAQEVFIKNEAGEKLFSLEDTLASSGMLTLEANIITRLQLNGIDILSADFIAHELMSLIYDVIQEESKQNP